MILCRELNFGFHDMLLPDKIVELAVEIGLNYGAAKDILNHVISEFSNNGIGDEYYGYHDIRHELEVTYFTLLIAKYHFEKKKFNQKDVITLFIAALLHDFDPKKEFDKPDEDNVESSIRNDQKLTKLIASFDIDLNLVLVLIHRTTYPFNGKQEEHAKNRVRELFSLAGIYENDTIIRGHYEKLASFLSVCDRIAGYCLRDFVSALELVRRHAISMAWRQSEINIRSVEYFTTLKEEQEMLDFVLKGSPNEYRKNLFNNIAEFRLAWENEVKAESSLRINEC